MTSREPLPFDPIMRAATLWERRIGPSQTMAGRKQYVYHLEEIHSAASSSDLNTARHLAAGMRLRTGVWPRLG